jgi:hypothetical protein
MSKEIEWLNDDHMKIETGHKAFDHQCTCISKGNVIGNCQLSAYIRAFNCTEDGQGQPCLPGKMQQWDLNEWMFRNLNVPNEVKGYVYRNAVNKPVILYVFFHWAKERRIVHGWILTTADHKYIGHYAIGPTYKSQNILMEVRKYICDDEEDSQAEDPDPEQTAYQMTHTQAELFGEV